MSPRRRAVLLLGLALILGGFAASNVHKREVQLKQQLGPLTPVVFARRDIKQGDQLGRPDLAIRRVPARFVPRNSFHSIDQVIGSTAAVAIAGLTDLTPNELSASKNAGPPIRPGERIAQVLAVGPPELIQPGSRVDVVVTRDSVDGKAGRTVLALEDVEVIDAQPAPSSQSDQDKLPQLAVSLRVQLSQAVYLTAAQAFAREIRLLPRPPQDTTHQQQRMSFEDGQF